MHHGLMGRVGVPIIGASGFGAELVRLLGGHPQVDISALYARNRDDAPMSVEFPQRLVTSADARRMRPTAARGLHSARTYPRTER